MLRRLSTKQKELSATIGRRHLFKVVACHQQEEDQEARTSRAGLSRQLVRVRARPRTTGLPLEAWSHVAKLLQVDLQSTQLRIVILMAPMAWIKGVKKSRRLLHLPAAEMLRGRRCYLHKLRRRPRAEEEEALDKSGLQPPSHRHPCLRTWTMAILDTHSAVYQTWRTFHSQSRSPSLWSKRERSS
jgi:hypothetical protein